MNFFKRIFQSCISFQSYDEIVFQKGKTSFFYFFIVILLTSVLVYPKYFAKKTSQIYPVLDEISLKFPSLEFKDNRIITVLSNPEIINNSLISIVIDPDEKFKTGIFSGSWILFRQKSLQFNYKNNQGQNFSYQNPIIDTLFTELAGFHNGTGILDGKFFSRLKETFKKTYILNGIFFSFNLYFMGFILLLVFTIYGRFYSKIIRTNLTWKQVLNLSYYSITPVIMFFIICYHLNLDIERLQMLFFLMYFLFLTSVIRRFKIKDEDSLKNADI